MSDITSAPPPSGTPQAGGAPAHSQGADSGSGGPRKPAPAASSGGGLCFKFTISLLVLVLLAAVGAGGYLGYFYGYAELERLKARLEQLGSSMQDVAQAGQELRGLRELNAQLQEDSRTIRAQSEEIRGALSRTQELAGSVSTRLENIEDRDPNDWFIANAFLMLSQAHQHLIYDHQLDSALYKVRFADKLLEHISSPDIVALRRTMARDLTTLESQPHVDFAGIAFTLDSLYANIDRMAMTGVAEQQQRSGSDETSGWMQNLLQSARDFSARFIEIRRKDEAAIDAVLDPEFAAMVREQVKLRLSLAKAHIMDHDIGGYQENLRSLAESLARYFDRNDPVLRATAAKVQELLDTPITYQLSNGLESYAAVEELFRKGVSRMGRGAP